MWVRSATAAPWIPQGVSHRPAADRGRCPLCGIRT